MIKKLMMLCVAAMAATGAWSATNMPPVTVDPRVTDIVAKQRYPWNGFVDITCRVSGIVGTTNKLELAVAAVMPDTGIARGVRNFWVVRGGSNSTDRVVTTNGNYRLLWDAHADLGVVDYSNMVVRVTWHYYKVQYKVQLWEGGPYWATTNIGAENPEDYGYYFWWGDTVGYKRENNKWVASDGSNSNFSFNVGNAPTCDKSISTLQSEGWIVSKDGTYVLAPEHDAAQVQWGGDWRMPTLQELANLWRKCDWTWDSMYGVNGYFVRGRGSYASNSIFLPCAGCGNGTSLGSAGSLGGSWSSVPLADSYNSTGLSFDSSSRSTNHRSRILGWSVRPVQGFTK